MKFPFSTAPEYLPKVPVGPSNSLRQLLTYLIHYFKSVNEFDLGL